MLVVGIIIILMVFLSSILFKLPKLSLKGGACQTSEDCDLCYECIETLDGSYCAKTSDYNDCRMLAMIEGYFNECEVICEEHHHLNNDFTSSGTIAPGGIHGHTNPQTTSVGHRHGGGLAANNSHYHSIADQNTNSLRLETKRGGVTQWDNVRCRHSNYDPDCTDACTGTCSPNDGRRGYITYSASIDHPNNCTADVVTLLLFVF